MPVHRGNVNDVAILTCQHRRQDAAYQVVRPFQIGVHAALPVILVQRQRIAKNVYASAVNQDINIPQRLLRLLYRAANLLRLRDIGCAGQTALAGLLLQLRRQRFAAVCVAIEQRQAGAFARKQGGDGAADAAAGTGNDGGFIG